MIGAVQGGHVPSTETSGSIALKGKNNPFETSGSVAQNTNSIWETSGSVANAKKNNPFETSGSVANFVPPAGCGDSLLAVA